ncbi:MAG: thermonuclease family protein [Thioalkalispiraceae bacterium]|jgi:endonuclease YncB( thermonuclease family)
MQLWHVALKKAPFIGAFFFVAILSARADSNCSAQRYDEIVTLEKVYDGDTIKLTDGRKIRFIAINTPELSHDGRPEQPYALEAKLVTQQLFASSRTVKLKFGKDKKDRYKRTLAHVFTADGRNVSAELIKRGLGFAIVVPPNTWNTNCYFGLEQQARQALRGIWSDSYYRSKNPLKLQRANTGFQIIEGSVTGIGRSKKSIWLDMGDRFSIRINRKKLVYFKNLPIADLKGKRIRARGWIAFYNHKLRMSLNHPAMMSIIK